MDMKEFLELEQFCKRAWRELAETGSTVKPESLGEFINYCPACEIAATTNRSRTSDCRFCPIKSWRKAALDNDTLTSEESPYSICDKKTYPYHRWRTAEDIDSRKKMAKKISELEWEYLPEYADPKWERNPLRMYRVEIRETVVNRVVCHVKATDEQDALDKSEECEPFLTEKINSHYQVDYIEEI